MSGKSGQVEAVQSEEQLQEAIKNAQSFSLIPILIILREVTGVDFSNKVGVDINAKPGTIEIKSEDKKIEVGLSVVDSNYNIMDSFNECGLYKERINSFLDIEGPIKEQLIELISFLLKCALLCFNELKNNDLQMEITEHQLDMDENTRLYILSEGGDKKMISVKFKKV